MEKIFFIDNNDFVRSMIEKVFKSEGIEVFTTDEASDCIYLIEDLSPTRLLVDMLTIESFHEDFFSKLDSSSFKGELILVGNRDLKNQFKKTDLRLIEKPISPTGLSKRIVEQTS